MNYTTIDHDARMRFGLSCNEYCVADRIYHLANNPENTTRWCYAKRETLGEMLGFSKQSIINLLKPLIKAGLVEMHPETKHLRTTQLWYNNFTLGKESLPSSIFTKSKESLPKRVKKVDPPGKESLPETGKESLPPSNNKTSLELEEEEDSTDRTREDDFVLPGVLESRKNALLTAEEIKNNPPVAGHPLTTGQIIDQYHAGMVADKDLIESAAVKYKLPRENYHEALGDFIIGQKGLKKTPKSEEDFRQHFLDSIKYWKKRQEEAETSDRPQGRIAQIKENTDAAAEKVLASLMDGTFKNPLYDFDN